MADEVEFEFEFELVVKLFCLAWFFNLNLRNSTDDVAFGPDIVVPFSTESSLVVARGTLSNSVLSMYCLWSVCSPIMPISTGCVEGIAWLKCSNTKLTNSTTLSGRQKIVSNQLNHSKVTDLST